MAALTERMRKDVRVNEEVNDDEDEDEKKDVSSFGRRNRRRRRRRRNKRKQQRQLSDDGEDAWRYALRVRFVWVRVLHAVTGWDGDIYAGVCASAGAGADDDGGAFVVGIRTSLAARWDCFATTDDDE